MIALTKRALDEAGINVTAIEAAAAAGGAAAKSTAVARSSTALLVKNLPYSATEAELEVGQHIVVIILSAFLWVILAA